MSKHEFHKVWIKQCEATEGIREQFGLENAIRYLIGEKFIIYLEASDSRPEFAAELPKFVAQVKEIFLYLLFLVYEAPKRREASLTALHIKAAALEKQPGFLQGSQRSREGA